MLSSRTAASTITTAAAVLSRKAATVLAGTTTSAGDFETRDTYETVRSHPIARVSDENKIPLTDLWRDDQTAVLVFLRHFG